VVLPDKVMRAEGKEAGDRAALTAQYAIIPQLTTLATQHAPQRPFSLATHHRPAQKNANGADTPLRVYIVIETWPRRSRADWHATQVSAAG
jgi:hypothetical protein